MRVAVIGAGLGGLAAGIAVRKAGHDVAVYERADELRETGSGIGLMPNGVLALDRLGVGEPARRMASPALAGAGLRDYGGRLLIGTRQHDLVARTGAPVVVAARRWLHRLLADQLPAGVVHTGTAVRRVYDEGDRVRIDTGIGERIADLVVAADGVGSTVRAQLFRTHPGVLGIGELAARALVRRPAELGLDELPAGELLDHRTGRRFGCMPMAGDQVYWYASWPADHADHAKPTDHRESLLAAVADWHPAVAAVIAATEPDGVHVDEMVRLARPLPAFVAGRIALLGDAAHAMTPDLGQGACQAFEDAVVLGHLLAGVGDAAPLAVALRRYDRARRPHTGRLLRASTRMNRMLTMTGRPARVRNLGLRAMPAPLAARMFVRQVRPGPGWPAG